MDKKINTEEFWYDNPNVVTSLIIGLIAVIIILSQSFAINNKLTTFDILRNIINHNSIYFISLVYFVFLKTRTGKKYFNFLNLFLILFYFIISITSLLTVFQNFSLMTLINLTLNVIIFIYLFHEFLRKTRIWKEFGLVNSPFNEIKNDAYFYGVIVLSACLLSLNLIFSTSFDGTILALLDFCYIILFARYIYLYGYFLDRKEKKKNINTTKEDVVEKFNDISEKVEATIDDVIEKVNDKINEHKEDLDNVKNQIVDTVNDLTEKVSNTLDEVDLKNNSKTKSKSTKKVTKKGGE